MKKDSKSENKSSLFGRRIRLAEKLNLPKETVYGLSYLSLIGDRDVYIENYLSILEYTDKGIKLRVSGGNLVITGRKLNILYFNDTDMQIRGCIEGVSFERR